MRDSVPALRVLYGTSNEEQRRTTDFRATDGTVDGLGEITRPNASAKTTIFLGARLYIELLQLRVSTLQRKVHELEDFRMAVAGDDDLRRWQKEFDLQEQQRQASDIASHTVVDESFDEEEEEEDDERKRKKPRVTKLKGKAGLKGKEDPNFGPGGPGRGVRVFAAFAMSFSLLPSASTLFKHSPSQEAVTTMSGTATNGQVLSRLPLITAEHTSRLLSRGLPSSAVPHPHTLVDWGWRVLVAVVLAMLLGPIVQRWSRKRADVEVPAGSISGIASDTLKLSVSKWMKGETVNSASWNILAAGMLGGGESTDFNSCSLVSSQPDRTGEMACDYTPQSKCQGFLLVGSSCPVATPTSPSPRPQGAVERCPQSTTRGLASSSSKRPRFTIRRSSAQS